VIAAQRVNGVALPLETYYFIEQFPASRPTVYVIAEKVEHVFPLQVENVIQEGVKGSGATMQIRDNEATSAHGLILYVGGRGDRFESLCITDATIYRINKNISFYINKNMS
jgi:hypothetical protein